MTGQIKCAGDEIALNLKTTLSGSTPFNFKPWRGARIQIPSGSPITTLTFYAGKSLDNRTGSQDPTAFLLCQDISALTVAAGKDYKLPDDLFACHALVILADAAGDVVITTKS